MPGKDGKFLIAISDESVRAKLTKEILGGQQTIIRTLNGLKKARKPRS